MKITPIDIQQQQFKGKMFGGLDQEDVDSFLQSVAAEMENLVRENNELKEQQSRQSRDMFDLAEKEKELREVMLGAQRITEDMKTNARKEADLIVSEAELKAERIVADSERHDEIDGVAEDPEEEVCPEDRPLRTARQSPTAGHRRRSADALDDGGRDRGGKAADGDVSGDDQKHQSDRDDHTGQDARPEDGKETPQSLRDGRQGSHGTTPKRLNHAICDRSGRHGLEQHFQKHQSEVLEDISR